MHRFTFSSTLHQWSSQKGSWFFVDIPKDLSQKINQEYAFLKAGWGSIKVEVTIFESKWDTSIFPEKRYDKFILPIKSSIHKKYNLNVGDQVIVKIYFKLAI